MRYICFTASDEQFLSSKIRPIACLDDTYLLDSITDAVECVVYDTVEDSWSCNGVLLEEAPSRIYLDQLNKMLDGMFYN